MNTNNSIKPGDNAGLKRVLGRTDVLTLAFGTMVGWGWVMLSGLWIKEAGVLGSLLAFAIGAALCILVGLTYAELTAALPLAGGEMVYAYRALGQRFAWLVGWAISFAYIGVAAWRVLLSPRLSTTSSPYRKSAICGASAGILFSLPGLWWAWRELSFCFFSTISASALLPFFR